MLLTVTSGFEAVSVHVVVENCEKMAEVQNILSRMRELIKVGIEHATIQIDRRKYNLKSAFEVSRLRATTRLWRARLGESKVAGS